MKILITGVAGTGKSTISKILKERGFIAVDFSEVRGMCFWRNKITREKVKYFPVNDSKWFDLHERICDIEKLKEVLDKYKNLVVTGIASGNQTEYLNLFDKVLFLQCNPETRIHRMQTRESSWGKTKAEQEHTLKWQKDFDLQFLSKNDVIIINTEETLDTVIDKIIAQL